MINMAVRGSVGDLKTLIDGFSTAVLDSPLWVNGCCRSSYGQRRVCSVANPRSYSRPAGERFGQRALAIYSLRRLV